MLVKSDEFLCHQIVEHFDEVSTSDKNWTEKIWGAAYDNSGKIIIDFGFGKYTNRNIMDGYAIIGIDGTRQYNLRVSRELRPNIDDIAIGPLSYEVVKPLQQIRLRLDDNDQGISFDLLCDGNFPLSEETPQFEKRNGVVTNKTRRYYQFGSASGTLTVEGQTYTVDKEGWSFLRDHSWGIRPNIGLPPKGSGWSLVEGLDDQGLQPPPPAHSASVEFASAQFKGWALHYWVAKTPDGQLLRSVVSEVLRPIGHVESHDRGEQLAITHVEHETEYGTDDNRPKSSRAIVHLSDGSKKVLDMTFGAFCCVGAGGYFGFRGWNHGKWMGTDAIAGEKLDLTDDDEMAGMVNRHDDYVCQVRCGDEVGVGIYTNITGGRLGVTG